MGWHGATLRPWVTPARSCVTWEALVGEKQVCLCLSYQGVGARLSGLGCVGGGDGMGGPLSLSFQ